MAGQPSAPEDHAATLLQAEPRSHDTVFMVRVQLRFRSWGLMMMSGSSASTFAAECGRTATSRLTEVATTTVPAGHRQSSGAGPGA